MILAVDLGSTNWKGAVFSDGERLAEAARPLPYSVHTTDRSELDPDVLWTTFLEVVDACLDAAGQRRGELQKIALTSQAQTFCLCDRDGTAVTPFLGWTDTRAYAETEELQHIFGSHYYETTGFSVVSAAQTLPKVLWWRNQGVDLDGLSIVQLPCYLAMRLGARHCTDRNLAAMSGLYAIPQNDWWAEVLAELGIDNPQAGALVAPGEDIATDHSGRPAGFHRDLKIVMAGNDHTAGAVGCGRGCSTLTLGTAGVIYRCVGDKRGPYSPRGIWGPYPAGGFYELQCLNHACSALDWADGFLFGAVDSPRFVLAAMKAPLSLRTPYFYPEKWGSERAWSGIGSLEERAVSVLEGIGFALLELARVGSGEVPEEYVVLGGGSRLTDWLRLLANIFECPLRRSVRDGLDGAAILAKANLSQQVSEELPVLPDPHEFPLCRERYQQWLLRKGLLTGGVEDG